MKDPILWAILILVAGLGIWLKVHNWHECRQVFSAFYCLTTSSR